MFRSIVMFILAIIFGIVALFGNLFNRRPEPPVEPPTTTVTTTTTTSTTTTTAARDPVVITIDRDALMAQFANTQQQVVQRIRAYDSIGREQNRTFTGVAIRDILAHHGVDLAAIPTTATMVLTTTNADGTASSDTPATHAIAGYANFMAATTLLAWHEIDHDNGDAATLMERPRLVFGDAAGVLWGHYAQRVTAITLNFN